jgi:hypothetical protein
MSLNHFDVRPVTWRYGERRVTGDERRVERLCEGHVHGVVRCDVLAQLPRTSQEINVRVPVEIEVGEVPIASAALSGDSSPVHDHRRRRLQGHALFKAVTSQSEGLLVEPVRCGSIA